MQRKRADRGSAPKLYMNRIIRNFIGTAVLIALIFQLVACNTVTSSDNVTSNETNENITEKHTETETVTEMVTETETEIKTEVGFTSF